MAGWLIGGWLIGGWLIGGWQPPRKQPPDPVRPISKPNDTDPDCPTVESWLQVLVSVQNLLRLGVVLDLDELTSRCSLTIQMPFPTKSLVFPAKTMTPPCSMANKSRKYQHSDGHTKPLENPYRTYQCLVGSVTQNIHAIILLEVFGGPGVGPLSLPELVLHTSALVGTTTSPLTC